MFTSEVVVNDIFTYMDSVQAIVNSLGSNKSSFLSDVKYDINSYISNRSVSDCLTLVTRYSDGSTGAKWYPSEVLDGYTERFIAFLRNEKYNDNVIDSALTDPVVEIVSKRFERFYSENASLISKPLLESILSNHTLVTQLANQIIDASSGTIPSYLKSQLTSSIVHYLEDNIHTNVVHLSAQAVQNIVATTTSYAVAIPVSATLLKYLAFSLKGVIAKLLATAATKTMLAGILKKIVASKIIAAIIALVGTSISGSAIAWVVAPLLAAYIAYEAYNLPSNLGTKVSEAVANELSGEFDRINRNVASQLAQGFASSALSSFAGDVAKDDAIKDMIRNFSRR